MFVYKRQRSILITKSNATT